MYYIMQKIAKISLLVITLTASLHINAHANENTTPIEIVADSLIVQQKKSLAFFSGNVVATQGDYKLKSDKMTIHYKNPDEQASISNSSDNANIASNEISKINVDGNVLLTTPLESAKGNKGEYDLEQGIITLTGNVVLIKGENLIKGSNLIHNLESGDTEITNRSAGANVSTKERVTGIFIPKNDLSKPHKQ